jgi:hypothetical protein
MCPRGPEGLGAVAATKGGHHIQDCQFDQPCRVGLATSRLRPCDRPWNALYGRWCIRAAGSRTGADGVAPDQYLAAPLGTQWELG